MTQKCDDLIEKIEELLDKEWMSVVVAIELLSEAKDMLVLLKEERDAAEEQLLLREDELYTGVWE